MKHTWWKFQLIIQIRNMFMGWHNVISYYCLLEKILTTALILCVNCPILNGYDEIHGGQHPAFLHNANRVNPSHHLVHVEYFSCVQHSDKSGLLSAMFDIDIDGCDCLFSMISACVTVTNWYSTLF